MQKVGCLVVAEVWWNVAFWCCPGCTVLLALFVELRVGFQWSVKISGRMGILEELLLWVPSLPAQLPVH